MIYINDIFLTRHTSVMNTVIYADDTTLIVAADSIDDLSTSAQSELRSLYQSFHDNSIIPDPKQTHYLKTVHNRYNTRAQHNAQRNTRTLGLLAAGHAAIWNQFPATLRTELCAAPSKLVCTTTSWRNSAMMTNLSPDPR